MRFRKKPIVIEAEQWFPGKTIDGVCAANYSDPAFNGYYYIETLEGKMIVSPGDWVITGIKGEKYPCKPAIFEATYEAVEDTQ
jgi:hypothetical protein